MFEHLQLKQGKNIICDKDFHDDMLMDVNVYLLAKNEELIIEDNNKESAVLLITGEAFFEFEGQKYKVQRKDVFEEKPYCVHISRGKTIKILAQKDTEILIQQKENHTEFSTVFYTPENSNQFTAGIEEFDGTSKRVIRTLFDFNSAPYSNMVLGEVISYTGRWNSYPPHHHPQPEVYYYKFDHPSGFGVSIIGDKAEVVKNNSASYIPGGLVHPQSTAPGYRMYYVWMIPHFKDNPWTERIFADEHLHLLNR